MTEIHTSTSSSATAPTRSTLRYGASLAVLAAAAGLGSFAAFQQSPSMAQSVAPVAAAAAAVQAAAPAPVFAQRGLPDFADLVQAVGPSVVYIQTAVKVGPREVVGDGSPFGGMPGNSRMEDFLRDFFGQQFGMPMPRRAPAPQTPPPSKPDSKPESQTQPVGEGSGFILSADGIVMTNAHVVKGADEVLVKLTDKREFKAKVLGVDERTDVAILKIEARALPFVRVGDVSKLRVGEWVIAIGAPFGLENTVTAGIVSAKQRDTGQYLRFIQTDVAINPGNSGGPLINMRGEVVGINSQILSGSGGYMGVSLSIPIDEAMKIADQLRATGSVQRGYLGVSIGDVDEVDAQAQKLKKNEGAAITKVVPKSPADKAGLKAGDIILKFNGASIEGSRDLQRHVGSTKPGDSSTVHVLRGGKRMDLTVVTGTVSEIEKLVQADSTDLKRIGLKVSDLSAADKRERGVDSGVLVDAASGAAARAGLQAGDVVIELGNVAVQDSKQLAAVVQQLPKKGVASVLYRRGEWTVRSGIRLSE